MTKAEILTKLIDISDFVEYAYSELYSTSESLSGIEGVDGVESAKSYASQADSYLFDVKQKIEELTEDISNATSV